MSNFAERVDAGIALLDERGPEGWDDKINLATLNIANARDCVLGQVYGRYGAGCNALDIGLGLEYGFWSFLGMTSLTEVWREKITARRLALARQPVNA